MARKLLFLFLIFSGGLCAQQKVHPAQAPDLSYAFGLKGGASFSNMYLQGLQPRPRAGDRTQDGIYLGLVYHRPLNRHWAFQGELLYSGQGYEMWWGDSIWTFREVVNLGYFNLPLLAQYVSPPGLSVYTGPQPGWLVFNGERNDFAALDLSWVIGGAYLSKIGLGAEVRYNAGITNIAAHRYDVIGPSFKARNRVVQAGLVYLFAYAKKRP